MADGPKSLVNVDIAGKAAEKLIDRPADGIAGLLKPWQIRRVARAEADAALIKAESDIAVTDLQRRATHRRLEEDAWHQQNMEQIEAKAVLLLSDGADASKVDTDWAANFFDKSRNVSNEEMQSMWARVLAGEVNAPGTFSRRAVNSLADLDRSDCELFTQLCGYCWDLGGTRALVYRVEDPIYAERGINFAALTHLESIGLLKFDGASGFRIQFRSRYRAGAYYGSGTFLDFEKDGLNELQVGHVLLTQLGRQLAPIAGGEAVPGFEEYVRQRWGDLVKPMPTSWPPAPDPVPEPAKES